MEEVLIELRRIANAMEESNAINREWMALNTQWRAENQDHEERVLAMQQAGFDEQKRSNQSIESQAEDWYERSQEKAESMAKEHWERLTARFLLPLNGASE